MSLLESNDRRSVRDNNNRFHIHGTMDPIVSLILFIIGILQFYVFWYLYYTLELPILGCISALMGTCLQIIGLIQLYQTARSSNRAKFLIGVLIGCTGLWAWYIVYYSLLIIQHIRLS